VVNFYLKDCNEAKIGTDGISSYTKVIYDYVKSGRNSARQTLIFSLSSLTIKDA